MTTKEAVEAVLGPSRTTKVDTQPNPKSSRSLETLVRVAGLGTTLLFLEAACAGGNPTPTPEVTPPPSISATATASETPTPDVTITPIPPPSETPTVEATPTETPSKGPEVTLSPTQTAENQKVFDALKQWTTETGNTGIPLNKEWTQFGQKQSLTMAAGSQENAGNSNFSPDYFTLDVGTVTLNDENSIQHFAFPLLQVDGAGNHYYVFMNNGPMDAKELANVGQHPTRDLTGMPDAHQLTIPQLQTVLDELKGDIFVIDFIYADTTIISDNPDLLLQEYVGAKPISRELADFTLAACKPGVDYHTLLNRYPEVSKIINQNPTQINAKSLPFPGSISVGQLPSY